MGLGGEDEVLIEEGNIEKLDEQDGDYNEQDPENNNLVGHRYNLRSRKLNINQTTFDQNKPQLISILKKVKNYEQKQNLENKIKIFATNFNCILHIDNVHINTLLSIVQYNVLVPQMLQIEIVKAIEIKAQIC